MILNARQNGFMVQLPADFFNDEVQKKYEKYYRSLLLPYNNLDDFMVSTIQGINFPGFKSTLLTQVNPLGKIQERQSAKPIEDQFERSLTLTFKLSDAFLNYFIFLDNALNYLSPLNVTKENMQNSLGVAQSKAVVNSNHPFFKPIRLTLLNNEGYAVASIVLNRPMLTSLSEMKLSYSSNTPQFQTFTATFQYYNFDLDLDFS
jgi:hypothetical protein